MLIQSIYGEPCPHFNSKSSTELEFHPVLCLCQLQDAIVSLIFSSLILVNVENKDLFQGTHRSLQVIYVVLKLRLQISWLISFSFTTLLSDIKNNDPISLCSLVWQKYLKALYTQSLSLMLFISVWLGASNDYTLSIYISRVYCALSVPFLLLAIESLASLNLKRSGSQFQKPIQENLNFYQNQFRKLFLKIPFL